MRNRSDNTSVHGLTDSHFHSLAMLDKGIDSVAVVKECKKAGMVEMLEIGLHPDDLENRRSLLDGIKGIYFTSGFSPANAANDNWRSQFRLLEKQANAGDIVAIGELGLDWYRNHGSHESQMALVEAQFGLAKAAAIPVVIHNREADTEILDLMKKADLPAAGILHCFSSDYGMAVKCVDLGYAISFAGNVTYKNAEQLRDAAAKIPLDALLIETDAPYLSPQPVRGSVNTPMNIVHTYSLIASLRGVTVEDLAHEVRMNLCRCLKLDPLPSPQV